MKFHERENIIMQSSSVVGGYISTGFYFGAAAGSSLGVITGAPAGTAVGFTVGALLIPLGLIYNTVNHIPMNATNLLSLIATPYTSSLIGTECGIVVGGLAGGLFFGGVGAAAGFCVGKVIEPAAHARLGYK
jgi:hypothetical protein